MKLKNIGLIVLVYLLASLVNQQNCLAQSNEVVLWVDVIDGNRPNDTLRMYFGNANGATYQLRDTLDLNIGHIIEKESPPPPPDGAYILWKSIPGRVNTWGTGFMVYDFRPFPTNAARKDTFKLGFASANTSANFVLKWDPAAINPLFFAQVDSMKMSIPGMPSINMLHTDSVVIEAAGDNGIIAATIYKMTTVMGVLPDSDGIPASFALHSNYPNPFNPSTTFSFAVPHLSHVTITVTNVLGQHVATVVDKEYPAGNYTQTWDASNQPSGIYFYKMHVDGKFSETKKLVLLR